MSRSLKLYVAGLVGASLVVLALTSFVFGARADLVLGMNGKIAPDQTNVNDLQVLLGLAFWIVLTLFAGALPVRMPQGTMVSVALAPIVGAMALGGPVAAGWVALIGTTEVRELRGRVPWYGTAANHAGVVLPAVLGGLVADAIRGSSTAALDSFVAVMVGA